MGEGSGGGSGGGVVCVCVCTYICIYWVLREMSHGTGRHGGNKVAKCWKLRSVKLGVFGGYYEL